ncbi:MAG: HPr family phosphocarrier protein [bacterium]
MVEKKIVVKNKLGVHARPAAMLVKTAASFRSDIHLAREGQIINGKSIMGVMMLAANLGSEVTISAKGEDEQKAVDAIAKLFEDRFGEVE